MSAPLPCPPTPSAWLMTPLLGPATPACQPRPPLTWRRRRLRQPKPSPRPRLVPAQALLRQRRKVLGPALLALLGERAQVGPAVETGIVAVVEDNARGIVADRLQLLDFDALLARHGHALVGCVTL